MTMDLSKGAAWMNGEIMPISEAKVPVTDWGFTRSDCTYDVASVRNGAFFRLEDYLDRFEGEREREREDSELFVRCFSFMTSSPFRG